MARGITATVQTEVEKEQVNPIMFVEFNFDSGVLRFWTGLGDLSWNSLTWDGSGDVIRFSALQESANVQANGMSFQFTASDVTWISLVLGEDIQGRSVNIWLGFVDSAGAVLADPVGPFEYRMDTMTIEDNPPETTITLNAESYLASLERTRSRRFTHDDQQIEFPGDLGLEFVAQIQNQEIKWGQG